MTRKVEAALAAVARLLRNVRRSGAMWDWAKTVTATVGSVIGTLLRSVDLRKRLKTGVAAAGSAIGTLLRSADLRKRLKDVVTAAVAATGTLSRSVDLRKRLQNAVTAAGSAIRALMEGAASALQATRKRGAGLGWTKVALASAASVILLGCLSLLLWVAAPVETRGDAPADGATVLFHVAPGATFEQITDTLVARGLVRRPLLFRIYGRLRRDDRSVRSGTYALDVGGGWNNLLDALVAGRVRMVPVTIPEGFTLPQIATRVAGITELAADTVQVRLDGDSAHVRWNLPGPGLEGYLFPDTYLFAGGVPLEAVVEAMSERYRSYWTSGRRARAAELALSERQVVTLASIIQAEVRVPGEMATISAVYHNRLRIGMRLQADPTVLYALGGHRPRLLFAAIDSVADHPYNTYTQGGLPPGPIGAPGAAALDAALQPAEVDYLYFVANADGSHTFSRTLSEHNRARARARREANAVTPRGR